LISADVTVLELSSAMIRVFEGSRLTAYTDSNAKWTIGFGHTGAVGGVDIHEGMVINQETADALLAQDQAPLFAMVKDRPLLEAAALVSFGYNCGIGALAKVLQGHAMLDQYVRDHHGHVLPGLVARRALEELLILVSQQRK